MLTINHALTGAILASAVDKPILAVPLALVSHIALDVLPHFGVAVRGNRVGVRNALPLYRRVTKADISLTLISLALLPLLQHNHVAWWLMLGCMLSAILPDVLWVYYFFRERKSGEYIAKDPISRWHKRIQWAESPGGLVVDICWFITMIFILGSRFA